LLDSLLSTLKPRQLESIKHTQAPQLILAGTGKTTTITAKIAHMVECGIFDKGRVGAMRFVAVRGHIVRRDINIHKVINMWSFSQNIDYRVLRR